MTSRKQLNIPVSCLHPEAIISFDDNRLRITMPKASGGQDVRPAAVLADQPLYLDPST